jgi:hypothetical protein
MACIADDLTLYYNVSAEKATEIVNNSFIPELLANDKDAEIQMHEPLDHTVREVFTNTRVGQ